MRRVAQQSHAAIGDVLRLAEKLRPAELRGDRVQVHELLLVQAKTRLGAKHARHRFVDARLRNAARSDRIGERRKRRLWCGRH